MPNITMPNISVLHAQACGMKDVKITTSTFKLTEIVCEEKCNSLTLWLKTDKATFPMHWVCMINVPTTCPKIK